MNTWLQNTLDSLSTLPVAWWAGGGATALFFVLLIYLSVKKRKKIPAPQTPDKKTDDTVSSAPSPQTMPTSATPSEADLLVQVEEETRPSELIEIIETDRLTWLSKLRQGLSKTRHNLHALKNLFVTSSRMDADLLEQLHETLYRADFGTAATDKFVSHIEAKFKNSNDLLSWQVIQHELSAIATGIFNDVKVPIRYSTSSPTVILIVGVNGVGKTTTIGKLAAHYLVQEKTVLLCAADTYRAAAIEQLQVWADRLKLDMIRHQAGADPAAVAYDAVKAAIGRHSDILLVDTAGRLHNKNELMQELQKITRVLSKDLPGAPHEIWLVVDATSGQNTLAQIKSFKDLIPVSGLIVTKLDGTAKGGVLISATEQYGLPIRYIGVGEKASDLHAFTPEEYIESLFDL